MPQYKLTYFDFAGSRGEECRLALHLTGVPFEDERIDRAAWAVRKPQSPFGGLPVLTVAGKGELAQSNAILQYLGRAHGLLPSDPWLAARHEALMCAVEDFRMHLNATARNPEPAAKQAAREEFARGYLRTWAAAIERQLGDGPFAGGAEIGVADLKLYIVMKVIKDGGIDHVPTTAFADFPRLERLYGAVGSHPGVVAWQQR